MVPCPGLAAMQQGWEDCTQLREQQAVISLSRRIRVHRRPNALLALDIRQDISVSRPPDEDRTRYVKSSTFFSVAPSILIDGSG